MTSLERAFRLLVGNVLWSNDRLDELVGAVVAVSRHVDAVALCELTVGQAAAFDDALRSGMPHAVVEGRDDTEGVGLWSRRALVGRPRWFGGHRGIDAVVAGAAPVRLLLVHPDPPLPGAIRAWRSDLALIAAEAADTDGPVIVCGDLNAPSSTIRALRPFRDAGFVDAHAATGDRRSRSWPAHRPLPRVARLDRALVRGLVARTLGNAELPGSDHDGFVVELRAP